MRDYERVEKSSSLPDSLASDFLMAPGQEFHGPSGTLGGYIKVTMEYFETLSWYAKLKEPEPIHSGSVHAGQYRNVSPATKGILALLARQTKIALEQVHKDYDRKAFL